MAEAQRRIVLFGATGYTGRLTAECLVQLGARPVLAARSPGPLRSLADELGGLDTARADVEDPETVRDLVEAGDVLISTVGPFARVGEPAVRAAVEAGAAYFDSTGESPFIRDVFERHGPDAERSGAALVTACGWDFVPGNLAAALALERAGDEAVRVDVGYFMGSGGFRPGAMSGGTLASLADGLIEPTYSFRGGRIENERGARSLRRFEVGERSRPAVTIGTSEHFTLPRLHPALREVNAYLGWFGALSRPMQVVSALNQPLLKVPGLRRALQAGSRRLFGGSSGGPPPDVRRAIRSTFVAVAYDASGRALEEVQLTGPDGYTFTAALLPRVAMRAAEQGIEAAGALGPVEAFGLEALEGMCREAGLERAGTAEPRAA
jgi:short subunit dehydrogenase-like uncharacterized protein